jgi:hypothetical protein
MSGTLLYCNLPLCRHHHWNLDFQPHKVAAGFYFVGHAYAKMRSMNTSFQSIQKMPCLHKDSAALFAEGLV